MEINNKVAFIIIKFRPVRLVIVVIIVKVTRLNPTNCLKNVFIWQEKKAYSREKSNKNTLFFRLNWYKYRLI